MEREVLERKDRMTMVFVDGDQLEFAQKSFGKVDYIKFLRYLTTEYGKGKTYIYFYFGTGNEDNKEDNREREESWKRKIDYICNKLFEELKDVVAFYKGFPLSKNNVDVNLANDFYESLFDFKGKIERIILISGDGDYTKPVRRAKREGIEEILIMATEETCSKYLKALASEVCYIDKIIKQYPDLLYKEVE